MTDYRTELQRLVKAYDEHGGRWPQHHEDALHEAVEAARTALAQPEPEGPTDQDLDDLANEMLDWNREGWRAYARAAIAADRARYARPTIEPVPVAERPWEREGWCDAEQTCWAIGHRDRWERVYVPCRDWSNPTYTHLLPHHALPVPGAEDGQP